MRKFLVFGLLLASQALALDWQDVEGPPAVWDFFRQILEIPRCSGNEALVLDLIHRAAVDLGLKTERDHGNLIVHKPASTSSAAFADPVIIQTHVDMVCEKNADSLHDFEKQGILAELVAGWILARNTTLGADNGLGVATAMALFGPMPSPAPTLVLVFTVKEEVSLDGARALFPSVLPRRWLLNLDSEEYGILYIGSAGGATDILRSKVMRVPLSAGLEPYDLIVDGLAGGHSGADIHLGHKNALKVAAEVVAKLFQIELSAQLIDFAGGDKDNAIPRRAFARLGLPSQKVKLLEESLRSFESEIRGELTEADKDFRISLKSPGVVEWPEALHEATRSSLQQLLEAIPHGPLRFSEQVPGLVETSNNLAKVSIAGDTVSVTHFARSAVDAQLAEFRKKMKDLADSTGFQVDYGVQLPGWAPNAKSRLLELSKEVFVQLEGREPEVAAIHAGLECGVFAEKLQGIDMISFGPDIQGAHAPGEKVEVSSVARNWELLLGLLARLAREPPLRAEL